MSSFDYLDLCRLCLVKDQVSVPIFEGDGDARQIFHKISFCLPVKVDREDKLPKKICDDCAYKVELCYQFYNTTANAEKQLLQWLGEVGLEDKQDYEQEVMNSDMMKQEPDNRINVTVLSSEEQSNNMEINMIDGMSLSLPIIMTNQQMPAVSMSSTDNLQNIQSVAGTSVQTTRRMQKDGGHEEIEDTEEDDNSEDECDVDEGMQVVKEESENSTSGSRSMEPTTFVNVALSCNEAGPSGLQQQKLGEISEMGIQQSSEGDTKTGCLTKLPASYAYAKYPRVEQIPITSIKSEYVGDVIKAKNANGETVISSDDKQKVNVIKIKLLRVNCATKEPPPMIPLSLPPVTQKKPANSKAAKKSDSKKTDDKSAPKTGKRYKCKICGKESWNFHQWERHYRLDHGKPKAEKCSQCDRIFYDDEKLARHVVKMHQEERPFPCHICNKPFKTDKFLRIHLKQHNKRYSCEICGMSKVSPYDLRLHMMKHNKEYYAHCEYCQRGFYTKQSLQRHILTHTGERPFVCRICNASYASASYLSLHAKSHSEREKFKCSLCDYETYWKTSLKGHVKKHTGENRIKCEVCGKSVSSQSYLQVHMRIHTGEKPNICEVCGKCFSVRKYLIVHLRTHTGERPYECKICHKRFTQHGSLNSHMKGHKGDVAKVEEVEEIEQLEEEYQD